MELIGIVIAMLAFLALAAAVVAVVVIIASRIRPEIYIKKIVQADSRQRPGETMFSKKYLLAGRPDVVVEDSSGIYPLEFKSANVGKPVYGHEMQLVSYCLLLEEQGKKVSKGILQYGTGKMFEVEYTAERKKELMEIVGEMRKVIGIIKLTGLKLNGCRHRLLAGQENMNFVCCSGSL